MTNDARLAGYERQNRGRPLTGPQRRRLRLKRATEPGKRGVLGRRPRRERFLVQAHRYRLRMKAANPGDYWQDRKQ